MAQEILDAADTIETGYQRLLAASQSVLLQARVLEAEERRFELGLITSTEVLEAQTNLADARVLEAAALADYQINQTDLAFATGTLAGYARLTWAPAGLNP